MRFAMVAATMKDLREFIARQAAKGRVDRISEEIDPMHEAGRVLARREGKIVLLERLRGGPGRVVGGVVSSRELLADALTCEPDHVVRVMTRALDAPAPVTVVNDAPFLHGPAVSTIEEAFPQLVYSPGASHPYLTASIVLARSPRFRSNLSFHRLMYLGDNRYSVRIVPRHLSQIMRELGGEAGVAVLLGVHPAVSLAAACSGPPELSELEVASRLLGGLEVMEVEGLPVPAHTEIVILGRITSELAEEGPFVDLTGTLDGVRQQPVFRVDKILARPDCWLQAIVPGGLEHKLLMGTPQEPRIFRAVANAVPCLDKVALTQGGCNWLHAAISLDSPRPGQARNAAMAALGAHPSLKRVIVVDADVDVHDPERLEWALATRVQPDRDVIIIPGCRGSSLDPSRSPTDDTTAKWIIDATIPAGANREEFLLGESLPAKG